MYIKQSKTISSSFFSFGKRDTIRAMFYLLNNSMNMTFSVQFPKTMFQTLY